MKQITIRRFPPVAVANFIAVMRLVSLALVGLIDAVYFPALFGQRAQLPSEAKTCTAILAYKWLLPIIMAWLSGFLACTVFNALAARGKASFIVDTEE